MPSNKDPVYNHCSFVLTFQKPTEKPASEQGTPDNKKDLNQRIKKEIEGDNGPAGGSNAAIKPKL